MTNSETSGVELPDMDLLKKFDVPAPRYTSYPTADRFNAAFTAEDYARALVAAAQPKNRLRFHFMCMCRSATMCAFTAAATRL